MGPVANEPVAGIEIDDSDVGENGEVPVVQIGSRLSVSFAGERCVCVRCFECRDVLDERLEIAEIVGRIDEDVESEPSTSVRCEL
ncbi:hypothetical protein HAPAU_15040 [Halalkalicoccus paucihalophilus]|uniref:Uncharacterized protein n=1 Tax=Halalkalicoccus paucihalophilus TaxID=1008153 RepID=A0A151AFH0_9EURY|nr:hypothetical protein HAPAU_15040 [Halalkalicoccus paucihalophilus]